MQIHQYSPHNCSEVELYVLFVEHELSEYLPTKLNGI